MAVWLFFLRRDRAYRIRARDLVPDPRLARQVIAVGAPSFLASFGATILAVVINTTLAAAGAVALAAYAVSARVQTLATMPQLGITQGAQPVISYNAGSGHLLRVDRARVLSLRATVVYRACAAALVAGFAQPLAGFFLSDPGAVELAAGGLRIIAVGFLFSGVTPLVSGYFQAFGRSTPAYAISLGTLLAIRLPLVLGLGGLGPAGVWGALALGEAASALVAWLVLRAATRTRPSACRP